MNTKCLAILLALFFFLPIGLFAHQKKTVKKAAQTETKIITRLPLDFDFTVEDVDNTLQIVFIGELPNADLFVTDKAGNIVWEEHGVQLYDGKMVHIVNSNGKDILIV